MAIPFGMLVEAYNYGDVPEAEFNAWYDNEHLPAVAAVPGMLTAQRWLNAEEFSSMPGLGGSEGTRTAVAIYDVENTSVFRSAAYLAAREPRTAGAQPLIARCETVCHFEAEQTLPGSLSSPAQAQGLMMFAMNVSARADAEFNAWFDDEHIPHLAAVPGVLAARRFRMPAGGSHRYLVLYHLSDPGVQASAAWKKGGASPVTERMKREFLAPKRNPLRLVLKRYQRAD